MNLPTQEDIKSMWTDDLNIKVSICCTAFNHENYIEETLQGFLIQETKFPFEIIIHDDASTDKTLSIIKKYKDIYSDLITLIAQDKNQYSQGKKVARDFIWSKAKGDYIAMCEGDDYWISKEKLQLQFDALQANMKVDLCFHDHYNLDVYGKITPSLIHLDREMGVIGISEILSSNGSFMSTASLMVKKVSLLNMPEWFSFTPVSDFFIQAVCSVNGALYLPQKMSVYRAFAPGSWTSKFQSMSPSELKTYLRLMDKSMEDLGSFLGNKYPKEISYRRLMLCLSGVKNSCLQFKLRPFFYFLSFSVVNFFRYLKN